MTERIYNINLDLTLEKQNNLIFTRRGEVDSTLVKVTIANRDSVVDLTGATIKFNAKLNTVAVSTDAGIELTNASAGEFEFRMPKEVMIESGKFDLAYFEIITGSQVIKTYNVPFAVLPDTQSSGVR